jgi:hypothetical protein
MPDSRSFAPSRGSFPAVCFLAALLLLQFTPGLDSANAEILGHMDIDIHDGEPWVPLWGPDPLSGAGNFMTGIDTWGIGFKVEQIWFYHGGDYPDSGQPYQINMIYRFTNDAGEEQLMIYHTHDAETTCNHCWETVDFGVNVWNWGSNEEQTFGVFIRPVEGTGGSGYWPRLWRDRYVDHHHLAALLNFGSIQPEPGTALGGRDVPIVEYYYSDYGAGEVLLGMEISSDVITSVGETNFSTIKSLY